MTPTRHLKEPPIKVDGLITDSLDLLADALVYG